MLRLNDFNTFYHSTISALNAYILEDAENKEGWQEKTVNFKVHLRQLANERHSLFDLKNELLDFCNSLHTPFKQMSNAIVGPFWAKNEEQSIGVLGMRLQTSLKTIVAGMLPFAAVYIFDEIRLAKEKPLNLTTSESGYVSFNFPDFEYEYLSAEGLRILSMIVNNEELTTIFLRQAQHFVERSYAQELLADYIHENRPSYRRTI